MESAKDLFVHELQDIYDAEHKLVNALESMSKKVANEELSRSFKEHKQVTESQIQRLDKVFSMIDRAATREPCKGINGLIEEFREFVKEEDPSDPVLNVFAASAAIKVENYEISGYKSLIKLADQLGLSEAGELFEQSLREEQETADQMEAMSEKLGHELPA